MRIGPLIAVFENGSIFYTPFRTMQFSGFGRAEGLSKFISHEHARAHANLYINIHNLNTKKQTRK